MKNRDSLITTTIILLLILMVSAIMLIGRDFFYPVFLAILFSYLLYPLVRILEKWRIPRGVAIFISVILGLILIGGVGFLLYRQISSFIQDSPMLVEQTLNNLDRLQMKIDDIIGNNNAQEDWWLRERISTFLENSENYLGTAVDATTGTILRMGLQPVFVFFMLYYRDRFKRFVFMAWGKNDRARLKSMLAQISDITKNYISGVFIVVLILCVINSAGLMIIGVEYAIMFGILSALMNFIPYFGTLIGALFPLTYTFVSDDPGNALAVVFLFLIIQFTENNILTPNITGGRVAINPFFTILIIIAGGMTWGVPGMFMGVPYAGMFKVICIHYQPLKPIAFLISRNKGSQIRNALNFIKKRFK